MNNRRTIALAVIVGAIVVASSGSRTYASCTADLDGDGFVGVPDLLQLLANWGPCANPADCPADLTGSAGVGVADLLALLSQWGKCGEISIPCCLDGFCDYWTESDCFASGGTHHGAPCEGDVRCPLACFADGPLTTIEGEPSLDFFAEVFNDNAVVESFLWIGWWPKGVGHNPSVVFKDKTADLTPVVRATWFAQPDSRWRSDTGVTCQYTITVTVNVKDKGECEIPLLWNVTVIDSGYVSPWPIWSGADTIEVTQDPHTNLWFVTGQGQFKRHALTPHVNAPNNSDFYDKVMAHEQHHVDQFAGIEPWASLWDVDNFYANVIALLIPQDTEEEMWNQVNLLVQLWNETNTQTYLDNQCEMEWQAYEVEYDVPPKYLEVKKEEVPGLHGCQF